MTPRKPPKPPRMEGSLSDVSKRGSQLPRNTGRTKRTESSKSHTVHHHQADERPQHARMFAPFSKNLRQEISQRVEPTPSPSENPRPNVQQGRKRVKKELHPFQEFVDWAANKEAELRERITADINSWGEYLPTDVLSNLQDRSLSELFDIDIRMRAAATIAIKEEKRRLLQRLQEIRAGEQTIASADAPRAVENADSASSVGNIVAEDSYSLAHRIFNALSVSNAEEILQADLDHFEEFDGDPEKTNSPIEKVKLEVESDILRYYNLAQEKEDNPSNGYDLPSRVITEAELREYIKDQASLLTERLSQEERPFPTISERAVKAIVAHGKKHKWDDRKERGWPYHSNAFVYAHITYRRWVNRGLTREILAQADPSLAAHLNRKISVEGLPGWLDLPTGAEARLRAIRDPVERAKAEGVREFHREKQKRWRKKAGPSPR